jgi:hypothetical protein
VNKITRDLVLRVSKDHKNTIIKHGAASVGMILQIEHERHLIAEYGVDLRYRAMEIYSWIHPEYFDPDGEIYEFADMCFNVDHQLSSIAMRVLWRRVRRTPELQLVDGWGELAQLTAQPQLSLF